MDQPYIGAIFLIGNNFAPQNWALCDGRTISISDNDTLFNLIGTIYGGDGQNTFQLPDLRGRVPIHQGPGPGLQTYVIGQAGGLENITVSVNQMATHTHVVAVTSTAATLPTPAAGSILGATFSGTGSGALPLHLYSSNSPNVTMNGASIGSAGGSQPISILQPILTTNYIISLYGIYPSQN